jgi:hypothetical protein
MNKGSFAWSPPFRELGEVPMWLVSTGIQEMLSTEGTLNDVITASGIGWSCSALASASCCVAFASPSVPKATICRSIRAFSSLARRSAREADGFPHTTAKGLDTKYLPRHGDFRSIPEGTEILTYRVDQPIVHSSNFLVLQTA